MTDIDDRIAKLVDDWRAIIGPTHHKSRDMSFSIEKTWEYGKKPTYTVLHYGYILGDIAIEFSTAADAHLWLASKIEDSIRKQIDHARELVDEDVNDDWGSLHEAQQQLKVAAERKYT